MWSEKPDIADLQERAPERDRWPVGDDHDLAEHQLDEAFRRDRHVLAPDDLAGTHDRDAIAELFDLFQLVRDEDHHQPVAGQASEDVEQLVALRCRDPRRRLVEDEQAGAVPQEAGDLQLLPLADRQRAGDGVGVEREPVALRRFGQLLASGRPVETYAAGTRQQEVVEHGERPEHERVLVEHPDAGGDGVAR